MVYLTQLKNNIGRMETLLKNYENGKDSMLKDIKKFEDVLEIIVARKIAVCEGITSIMDHHEEMMKNMSNHFHNYSRLMEWRIQIDDKEKEKEENQEDKEKEKEEKQEDKEKEKEEDKENESGSLNQGE